MPDPEIDLLAITRGTVTAPAGCGKTHLVAEVLKRHDAAKPIFPDAHECRCRGTAWQAGQGGRPSQRLSPRDNRRLGDATDRNVSNAQRDRSGHFEAAASFSRLVVDEHQDCSIPQHAIVYYAAPAFPVCVLCDPMQAIFGWEGNELADWGEHVCTHFPLTGELTTPWRWKRSGFPAWP